MPLLHSMKHDRLVAHKGAAMANDYVYQLTELGRERAKKFAEHCTYFGAAPVPLARLHSTASRCKRSPISIPPKTICTARSTTC